MMSSRSKSLGRSASSHRRSHPRRPIGEPLLSRLASYFYLSKETEAFNGFLYTFGRRHVKFLHHWFTGGVAFGLFAMVAGSLMLAWEAARFIGTIFSKDDSFAGSSPLITAVVPGLNVPLTDVGYMVFSLVFAIGIHEFGHGIAAASEGVAIEHVAVFLAFVFPGAMVALKRETLHLLSPFRSLRIYCAGIWHNAVSCAGCWIILLVLPMFLYPFYSHGRGAVILALSSGSPLAGHIHPGDMISRVNDRRISNSRDWFLESGALYKEMVTVKVPTAGGFCVSTSDIERRLGMHGLEGVLQNLNVKSGLHETSSKNVSLEEAEWNKTNYSSGQTCPEGELLFRKLNCAGVDTSEADEKVVRGAHCLKARHLVGKPKCKHLSESATIEDKNCSCTKGEECIQPVLNNGETLVTLHVLSSKPCDDRIAKDSSIRGSLSVSRGPNATVPCENQLFVVVDPLALASGVELVNYKPRSLHFAPLTFSAPLWLPYMLEKVISYILQYSAGLAVANSIPVFYLDGEVFLQTLMAILVPFMRPNRRKRLQFLLLSTGTFLLLVGVLAGICSLFHLV